MFVILPRIPLLSLVKKSSTIHCVPDLLALKNIVFLIFFSLRRYPLLDYWPGLWVDFGLFIVAYIKLVRIYIFVSLVCIPSWFRCVIKLSRQFYFVRIFMERTFCAHLVIYYICVPHIFHLFLLHILVLYFVILVGLVVPAGWPSSFLFLLNIGCPGTFQAVPFLVL